MSQCRNLADFTVILSEKDNVATAMIDIPVGEYILGSGENSTTITVPEGIKAGFKLALSDISKAEPIFKYGYVIGRAKVDIKKGHCVHIHNLISSV
ncbi:MAG: UxaA family hydrolase [Planctomycetes bacterium]|nr:UxaA family hydrolase [Planctomycetota bacterium]